MRKYKNKIIGGIVIVFVLVFAYWWGTGAPEHKGGETMAGDIPAAETVSPEQTPSAYGEEIPGEVGGDADEFEAKASDAAVVTEEKKDGSPESDISDLRESEAEIGSDTDKDKYRTDPVSDGRPVPQEPENAVISDKKMTCTLSVRCDTILDNIERLDKEKVGLVPGDGVIYAERSVTFYEGESVFNLLVREMKRNKIHMEFENTPIYNSAYIEGIGNLYEFDCGELSGWMYSVNGWFPNYGCSRYRLKEGDRVEWVYTCDLGRDVGGSNSTRNGFDKND